MSEDWGSAEFKVLSDTSNEKCRIVDVKLIATIRGEKHEMEQRVVFPLSIMKAQKNYDYLAETINSNVLAPWVDGIIQKQEETAKEEPVP